MDAQVHLGKLESGEVEIFLLFNTYQYFITLFSPRNVFGNASIPSVHFPSIYGPWE